MLNGASLKRIYDSNGAYATCRLMEEAIEAGDIKPTDFSLKEMAVVFCGEQWYEQMNPLKQREGYQPISATLLENEAVDSSAFLNLFGTVMSARIMQAYNIQASAVDGMVPTEQTSSLSEKIPGITDIIGDVGEFVIHEGEPYPEYGLSEDWIQTPDTEKRGGIISLTREVIYFDRTNQVLTRAGRIGDMLGRNRRLRIIDVIIGFVNNYNRQGTLLNTYLTSGAWVNKKTGVELIDWTDVDEALDLFSGLNDPYRNEPMGAVATPTTVIVMPAKRATANRIFGAGNIEIEVPVTGGTGTQVIANPYGGQFNVVNNDYWIYNREKQRNPTGASTRWYVGDPATAFRYYQNWGIEVSTQGADSQVAFERDIVARYRASERGIAAVVEPRAMAQLTG